MNWLQTLILVWEIDNFFRKSFWYVFEHYCFENKNCFSKKVDQLQNIMIFWIFLQNMKFLKKS